MKHFSFTIIGWFFMLPVFAQDVKHTAVSQQVWLGYFNQTRISEKIEVGGDIQLRTTDDFIKGISQSVLRAGTSYYLTSKMKATAGYAYFSHYAAAGHLNITQPEHRLWQQLQWQVNRHGSVLMPRVRLEQRFRRKIQNDSTLADGYRFNYRLRFYFAYEKFIGKKKLLPGSLSLVASDEVHINFGKQISSNYFDQNRLYAGIKYQVNGHDNLQAGYMYLFQQLPATNSYKGIHAARVYYLHNLDLRRKN